MDTTDPTEDEPRLLPDPELDSLIRRLNRQARERPVTTGDAEPDPSVTPSRTPPRDVARWPLPLPDADGRAWIDRLLERARGAGATDLLLVTGIRPMMRAAGKLQPVEAQPLSAGAVGMLAAALVPEGHRHGLQQVGNTDFALRNTRAGNLRCNIHRERGRWAVAVRLLPDAPPRLEDLHLPEQVGRLAARGHGLVLVTGPTGSGKSTTLAAFVRRILETRSVHLVTIEDPVEFEHDHEGSVVEHVEVGRDVDCFATALRSALRQDPDVLLVGEMRDADSMAMAIAAADTGHLVLATLHTGDAPQSIHRILDNFPGHQELGIRAQLASSLAAIVSLQLLPTRDGEGCIPAVEVMIGTPAVRALIRKGKTEQLRAQITLERGAGMLDLDHSLADRVLAGEVELREARMRARSFEQFDALVSRPRRS